MGKNKKVPQEDRIPTAFESRVYKVCKAIPSGKVATYGILSKLLKSSPRAVGQGLKRNPFAPIVPCHRVISSDFSIGGFSGKTGLDNPNVKKKVKLLTDEGVVLSNGKIDSRCMMTAEELQALLVKGEEGWTCKNGPGDEGPSAA